MLVESKSKCVTRHYLVIRITWAKMDLSSRWHSNVISNIHAFCPVIQRGQYRKKSCTTCFVAISSSAVAKYSNKTVSETLVVSRPVPVDLTLAHGVISVSDRTLDRLLAPVERQIVMSLLWLESAIPQSTMNNWVNREGKK